VIQDIKQKYEEINFDTSKYSYDHIKL